MSKRRLLGLSIMGMAVVAAITTGALAFKGVVSTDVAITIIAWSVFLGIIPGFILHMIAVVRQSKGQQH